MSKLQRVGTIALVVFCLLFIIVGFSGNYGVSNMDSLHLSDFNGTATPNFLVNQRGSGVIAEFQDGGTPIATWNNGGSFVSGGAIDLNAQQLIFDTDGDTISQAAIDDIITTTIGAATGSFDIKTGNLKVGDGSPTFTQDGEDAYVEGLLEVGGDQVDGAQSTFTVVYGIPITPTGKYQPITSVTSAAGEAASAIAAPTDDTIGKRLILHNINASQVITIDGTGTTVECKADIVLGAQDTLTLLWNGDDWICISNYDNS